MLKCRRMVTYNIQVEELISGNIARVYVGRTIEDVHELFRIREGGKSELEQDLEVTLFQVSTNEYIGKGYYVKIIERDTRVQDAEALLDNLPSSI